MVLFFFKFFFNFHILLFFVIIFILVYLLFSILSRSIFEINSGKFYLFLLGIKGDIVTYNALIEVHGKQGKIEQMKNDYDNMLKQGIKPNQSKFSRQNFPALFLLLLFLYFLTTISLFPAKKKISLFSSSKFSLSFEYHIVFPAKILLVTRYLETYNAILESLSKQGDNDMILFYMEEMTKNSIKMDLVTYNSIIDSFGKNFNLW